MDSSEHPVTTTSFFAPLVAGAITGIAVDVSMYPLDTLKTRQQSSQGFHKAGGYRGVYKGLGPVAAASMPTTALFFFSYESTKTLLTPFVPQQYTPFVHMMGASVGEVLACLIRVPTEIAKQRKQTDLSKKSRSALSILYQAYKTEGIRKGLYRGFLSTVARDLPFSFIEMPVWEVMKDLVRKRNDGKISSFQSALCGAISGAFAASITTPFDVAKTRIMLAEDYTVTRKLRIIPVLTDIYLETGVKGLFAGIAPRFVAYMAGSFVFFGAYEYSMALLT